MSKRPTEDFFFPSTSASSSQEGLESSVSSASSEKLSIAMLCSEWQSTCMKDGLSTINRELAIQFAKHYSVGISIYLPQCSVEEREAAASHNVCLIEAEQMPGFDPIDWLVISKDHVVHCVISHGLHLGRQVPLIKHLHCCCKWIHFVHHNSEELGMFKGSADSISIGQKNHQAEVQLCKSADLVVVVGPKLAEAFANYLRPCGKDQDIFNLTPSIFTEFKNVTQATEERKTFCVLMFGSSDGEDLQLKGYDIAAKAFAELKDTSQPYKLVFVGASVGEEEKVKALLLKEGIPRSQLVVRKTHESREQLAELFCEVDLVIMPSRIEAFGLAALEAISAGLPVLVSGYSGLADVLKKVPCGSSCVIDSEEPRDWAKAIRAVREKDRKVRLREAKILCGEYAVVHSWEEQCNQLVKMMLKLTRGSREKASDNGERPLSPSGSSSQQECQMLADKIEGSSKKKASENGEGPLPPIDSSSSQECEMLTDEREGSQEKASENGKRPLSPSGSSFQQECQILADKIEGSQEKASENGERPLSPSGSSSQQECQMLADEIKVPLSTTSTFRASSARLVILHQCRWYAEGIQFNQSNEFPIFPCVFQAASHFLVVHFVVAVVDKDTGEIWACNTTPELRQICVTRDGMFRIVPEVQPYAWMSAPNVDCRNKQVPSYAGNLTFLLPFQHEKPSHHVISIRLCHGVTDYRCEVLDAVQFIITSHERGTSHSDFQSGRTVTEIEKPIPRIQMQGVLANRMGRSIRMHFQNLGDNGHYDQFLTDRQKLVERAHGNVRLQDLLLAVQLEEAIMHYGQNKVEDCLSTCKDVCERATHLNTGNWPFLLAKAFYIISAVYRQAKQFDKANEYMERSSECLVPTFLCEETAVNRYNAAALLAEKSAAVGITADEERTAERLFEKVPGIWSQQKENRSMRCVIRSFNRMIMFFLKTSRTKFPDLGKDVSEVDIAQAARVMRNVEKNLLPKCPKRLEATFLIGKADYFIRRATRRGLQITEEKRNLYFQRAKDELDKSMRISRDLRMQKEIEGIEDRMRTIQDLAAQGLQWLDDDPPPLGPVADNEPGEGITNDLEDLIENLLISEEEENRRREDQCTD